jgi:tripartite ATP-independent transporter DctM subunit
MLTTLIIVFFLALIIGLPIFLTMYASVFAVIATTKGISMTLLPQLTYSGMNSFPILAIPLFILASDLMTEGKITDMLIDYANVSIGHIRGGLGHVNVLISMLFGGVSGSAVADAAGPSKIVMFMMRNAGYDKYYSGAVTVASSVIGIIIPPSIPMVIYALSDGKTSTMGLFAAGYIPGILIGLVLMAVNGIISYRKGYRFTSEKSTRKEKFRAFVRAFPGLLMPIIIIGFTVSGITTATEAAAIAVAYALFIGLFVTRNLKIKNLYKIFFQSGLVSSAILIIIGMGSLFSWILTYTRIPQKIAIMLSAMTTNPTVILFLMALLVLFTGMLVDTTPAVMILAPIISSIGASFGINPFQTAMIVVVGIGIGMMTPPVAPLMFITSSIGKLRMEKLIMETLPFILAEAVVLILIILIPALTTWLPALLGYGA